MSNLFSNFVFLSWDYRIAQLLKHQLTKLEQKFGSPDHMQILKDYDNPPVMPALEGRDRTQSNTKFIGKLWIRVRDPVPANRVVSD